MGNNLSDLLLRLVVSFGWEAPRGIWWSRGWRGTWRGIPVELKHMNRDKSTPERLLLTLSVAAPARVILKRRIEGFLARPITWFGPPLIEPMSFAERDQYWIRSDQPMFVETLLSRREVGPALDPNLIARRDVIDLDPKRLRIMRAVDDRAVKERFGRPTLWFSKDLELIETIATEEWNVARVLVESLGLRPAGMI
jgi:hypothetical protein